MIVLVNTGHETVNVHFTNDNGTETTLELTQGDFCDVNPIYGVVEIEVCE